MKHDVYKIVRQMAVLLGRDDIALEMEQSYDIYVYSPERQLLLESVNFVAKELAEEHFPLVRVEQHTTDAECKVALSQFDKTVHRIVSVLDPNGKKTTFRVFDDFVKLCKPNANFEFAYEYLPAFADFNQQIETVSLVTERLLAIGACATFCLATGLFSEAQMWDEKFQKGIERVRSRSRGEKRMPACRL